MGKALYLGSGEAFTVRRWEAGQGIPGPVAVALELFLRLPEHQRPMPQPRPEKRRGRPPLPPPDDAAAKAAVERIITAELPCSAAVDARHDP